VLRAIAQLKAQANGEAPIIGVVMSPFSVPVMQLGFDRYLELMHERPALFERLMRINEEFCVAWANASFRPAPRPSAISTRCRRRRLCRRNYI
jgi:uroporphyrinogen decarboxylase